MDELKIRVKGSLGEVEITFPRVYQKYPAGNTAKDEHHCFDKVIRLYNNLKEDNDKRKIN